MRQASRDDDIQRPNQRLVASLSQKSWPPCRCVNHWRKPQHKLARQLQIEILQILQNQQIKINKQSDANNVEMTTQKGEGLAIGLLMGAIAALDLGTVMAQLVFLVTTFNALSFGTLLLRVFNFDVASYYTRLSSRKLLRPTKSCQLLEIKNTFVTEPPTLMC